MNRLGRALEMYRRGWPTVPCCWVAKDGSCAGPSWHRNRCEKPGKMPLVKWLPFSDGEQAVTESLIKNWWDSWPNANIYLLTGGPSRLVVLDSDGEDGAAALRELEAKLGELPPTVTVTTGAGGSHYYFQHPGGDIRPSVGAVGPRLDVRADGSGVVAPPSIHRSGRRYAWTGDGHPADLAVAPLPGWLRAMVVPPPARRRGAYEQKNLISVGSRNTSLTSIAGSMRRQGVGGGTIADALTVINDSLSEPLPQTEVEGVAQSVSRYDPEPASRVAGYEATPSGIFWHKPTREGTAAMPLSNFTARIVGGAVRDDGVERVHHFEVEAVLRGQPHRLSVPAREFAAMTWVLEQLGPTAIVAPGLGGKDHLRAAIQHLSGSPERRTIYTSTGWRLVDGAWAYLHAGGAVGAEGAVPGVETDPGEALSCMVIPIPEDPVAAARAVFGKLEAAPPRIMIPLQGASFRAVLGGADWSAHLAGPTGAGKSELAALVQQDYGSGLDARHLPGNWSSTANSLEGLAFTAKDALIVIDDFAPQNGDGLRLHQQADRVLRAQGNTSGRMRMRPDGSLRPVKPPRGLVVSTGEDTPRGQSIRARLLLLEVGPGDVDFTTLTTCQRGAAAGLYARNLGGFLRWIAGGYEAIQQQFKKLTVGYRGLCAIDGHKRTPGIIGDLAAAWHLWLDYTEAVGALTQDERRTLWDTIWGALLEAGTAQDEAQASQEPATRFIELLAGAVASGRAHVANLEGELPGSHPEAWGWRLENDTYRPQGLRIGWVQGADLYLQPEAAYAAAQALGRDTGEPLGILGKTLHKRLHERGLLLTSEQRRHTTRREIEGRRTSVLHLSSSHLLEKPRESRQARLEGKSQA